MIPVKLQPEPDGFDANVRQKGYKWLNDHDIPLDAPPRIAKDLPRYWAECNKQLWDAYSGVCAYYAIYFEWILGASSTDHFIAKSKRAGDAYEWSNYRLCCMAANRNKRDFDEILDPMTMLEHTFCINFGSGMIFPNPHLKPDYQEMAETTIKKLKLDSRDMNKMRCEQYNLYLKGECSLSYLKSHSPFVYDEMIRHGLA